MTFIRPKKSLGQHFLHDPGVIRKIVDSIPAAAGEAVIEIGPGTGALTGELLSRFTSVRAIELDRRAVELLAEKYPGLDLLHADILKLDRESWLPSSGKVHVVGNLPYYITSQILFALLEFRESLESATLMMQKEVGGRIVASPGGREYGILSVQTQLMSRPEHLFDVSPGAFTPPPKVISSVLRFRFDRPPLACTDSGLKRVVRTAFGQRRKKLSNALKPFAPLPVDPLFDYDKRAEGWEPEIYEKLTARLEQDGTLV